MLSPAMRHVKWILPHAPQRRVTANCGMLMPAWFDLKDFSFESAEDEEGMLRSVRILEDIVRQEVESGIESSRIVLGGFSQGGTMSILTGLTCAFQLGGVAVLGGRLVLRERVKAVGDTIISSSRWLSKAKLSSDDVRPCKVSANFLGAWHC